MKLFVYYIEAKLKKADIAKGQKVFFFNGGVVSCQTSLNMMC